MGLYKKCNHFILILFSTHVIQSENVIYREDYNVINYIFFYLLKINEFLKSQGLVCKFCKEAEKSFLLSLPFKGQVHQIMEGTPERPMRQQKYSKPRRELEMLLGTACHNVALAICVMLTPGSEQFQANSFDMRVTFSAPCVRIM